MATLAADRCETHASIWPVACRKRQGYDVGLDGSKGFADRVMVHTVSRSQQTAYSSFEQSLQVGERWQEMRLDTQVNHKYSKAHSSACNLQGSLSMGLP
jgi:hypothetical protein